MTAIVVLGMHRSGTSCLAGMLAAGGLAAAGASVRNWDNARGHHEMLEVVRLDEAVLAHSGGHYLAAPREVAWTDEQAAARDRLLAAQISAAADGASRALPALLKDPRMLLVLAFWRASRVPFRAIGIVRHPLAVARSLESWRGMPLREGIALWTAHNRALAADRARHGTPIVDFDQPKQVVVAAIRAVFDVPDVDALAATYEQQLVHHDAGDAPEVIGLEEALALHRDLASAADRERAPRSTRLPRPPFPRAQLAEFHRALADGASSRAVADGASSRAVADVASSRALDAARAALECVDDASAVLVPVITALLRYRAYGDARALIAEHTHRLDAGLAELLHGKVLLAAGDAAAAVPHLEAACAVPEPLFQARHLLPQALRAAGRSTEARAALQAVAREALYPHGCLGTLAEWSWLDGRRSDALDEIAKAIAAAPLHRRGRLRTRRAEWLVAAGDVAGARSELMLAIAEDPGYVRSQEVLASLPDTLPP